MYDAILMMFIYVSETRHIKQEFKVYVAGRYLIKDKCDFRV